MRKRIVAVLIGVLLAGCATAPAPTAPPPTLPVTSTAVADIPRPTATLTVAPSAAPTATPSPTPVPPPLVGDATQAERAYLDDRMPHLLDLLQAQQPNPSLPAPTLTVPLALTGGQIAWDSYWCASDADTLDANLGQLTFSYSFDGQVLDAERAYIDTRAAGESLCQVTVFYLANLAPGQTYTLSYAYTVNAPINDGFSDFAPGTYTYEFVVTVTAP